MAIYADHPSDEEEHVDAKPAIEEECANSHHCKPFKNLFDACQARVEAGEIEDETCVEEFFDLMECVGHCAAPKIFATLK